VHPALEAGADLRGGMGIADVTLGTSLGSNPYASSGVIAVGVGNVKTGSRGSTRMVRFFTSQGFGEALVLRDFSVGGAGEGGSDWTEARRRQASAESISVQR